MVDNVVAPEFPVNSYVPNLSLLTCASRPYAYMLDVPSLLYAVCHVSNLMMMLIWVKLISKKCLIPNDPKTSYVQAIFVD